MIHPANFSHKTGFDQIESLLEGLCLSELGRRKVSSLSFLTEANEIRRLFRETAEFVEILQSGQGFPNDHYYDLSPVLNRIKAPGSWIFPDEIAQLRLSLQTISACLKYLRLPASAKYVHLIVLAGDLNLPQAILSEAERILDEKGNIKDNASPELYKLRQAISGKKLAGEKLIERLMDQARAAGWVSGDAGITISGGRMVIPVTATHKRKIKGIIHDESASGQTVYIEPEACLLINNEIRALEGDEKREIIRILTHFSDLLRLHTDILFRAFDFLGEVDFIRAKARFAIEMDAHEPELKEEPFVDWRNARHPILEMSLEAKNKTIVPLNIKLDQTGRILVITGPNAGGKSICLKTLGLLQYMLQCGILPPMSADSTAGIFKQLLLDLGDEQSLENDLSTYSSHLLNMKYFLEHGNPDTLFMIDELGTGTDPTLGGAIAEAALESLSETGAFGVVTTHFSNLKLLEGKVPGIVNGAMLFDSVKLQPQFILAIGKPGSSFTFEIATRMGLPEKMIEKAAEKAGKTHLDFEQQLNRLESEKNELESKIRAFQVADGFLSEMIEKYEALTQEITRKKKAILEKAREEAREMLEQSKSLIERTVKDIRESQADKEKTKSARSSLEKRALELSVAEPAVPVQQEKPYDANNTSRLLPGSWVNLEGRNSAGKIERIKGSKATVLFEGVRVSVLLSRLRPAEPPGPTIPVRFRKMVSDYNEKAAHFKLTLDVRGKSAEEAIVLVQKYLDDAYLLRIKEVNILHGKGEGILRKVIRDLLKELEEVDSFSDEHVERGGAGITCVRLR